MSSLLPKLITILGPTASGKSTLGIKLAQEFKGSPRRLGRRSHFGEGSSLRRSAGEIVSADSRQVYRGMDIGSGKVTLDEQKQVPHHLLDIVDPIDDFSLAHFQPLAFAAIDDIIKRDQLPFLVGGTALYIYSVVDNYNLTAVGANTVRRKELEKLSVDELSVILSAAQSRISGQAQSKDITLYPSTTLASKSEAHSAQDDGLNESDSKNPRRLIRAIEKLEAGITLTASKNPPRYNSLLLGTDVTREELYKKIDQRVNERIKEGMIEEVIKLRQNVPDEKLLSFGLEYRLITEHLQGKYTQVEMINRLKNAIHAFSRRQMTWFKRDPRIIWVKDLAMAKKQVSDFLK